MKDSARQASRHAPGDSPWVTLFLCGDVMTGRGIDQALPHPGDPTLHESYVKDARGYVELAERASGPFRRPLSFRDLWGDALAELQRAAPDVRLINLETSITTSDDHWKGKGIHYRMHPANLPCLTAAGIDVCSLANNHVLDWGYRGLAETLAVLKAAGIRTAGAGMTLSEAQAPAVLAVEGKGRVVVFACGLESSGIPAHWTAAPDRPGVYRLSDLSDRTVHRLQARIETAQQPNDILVVSIHWGGNWGYPVPPAQRRFAHQLIDEAGVDIVHGHSSHHVKGIEVYRNRLILYGCGDFLNDYEGIGGHQAYRPDLILMYLASLDPRTGRLVRLRMVPLRMRHFRPRRASRAEAHWLAQTLNREGRRLGTRVALDDVGSLGLRWERS